MTTKNMTTKDAIIYESLKLFSDNGYDAVSTRMIARAVGASDAVIYKHFKNKQEILNTIIDVCKNHYMEKCSSIKLETLCWKDIKKICMDMFKFQTTDEWIVMFRKLLIVEEYKNPLMKKMYREIFIDASIHSMTKIFTELINQGYIKKGTPEVYAMELYAPFFMYHTIAGDSVNLDSSGLQDSEQLLKHLEEHVTNFRKNVITDLCYLET